MTRIETYKQYIIQVLTDLSKDYEQINFNFLSNDPDNYSLDKIPTELEKEHWITKTRIRKDVYQFRCRTEYGLDIATNLNAAGFWEDFENKIISNNNKHIYPNLDGVENVECLNCGSLQNAETETCEMSAQIEFDYREEL